MYEKLVLGVFKQAIDDINQKGTVYITERDRFRYKREAYNFFHSEWGKTLQEYVGMPREAVPPAVELTAASQFEQPMAELL